MRRENIDSHYQPKIYTGGSYCSVTDLDCWELLVSSNPHPKYVWRPGGGVDGGERWRNSR